MENKQYVLPQDTFTYICREYLKNNRIGPEDFERYEVKRGLRNPDGSGVMAGLTNICNVHGYVLNEGEKEPVDGRLIYRGIDVVELTAGCRADGRFGFEETVWLLIFGTLPTADQLAAFTVMLAQWRELPEYFPEDMIIKAPSPDIMNKMARAVLALYSYDGTPEDMSLENILRQSFRLVAMLPVIMNYAYQVKRRHYDHQSMYVHPIPEGLSIAQSILHALRPDCRYTREEALLLDLCLILHAEHGGGNNSTFAARVLSSSGTDTYAAISAAIGSLKGPRHGGANIKVTEMLEHMKAGISRWDDDDEIAAFLAKLLRREAGDGSGLIYGMGHAVYTLSDPRAVILRRQAAGLAEAKGFGDELRLLEAIERLTPQVYAGIKGGGKIICANVDLYSGLVYRILGISPDLFTPLFAVARAAGWCAHRIEEVFTGGRIIRPAYKAIAKPQPYTPLQNR